MSTQTKTKREPARYELRVIATNALVLGTCEMVPGVALGAWYEKPKRGDKDRDPVIEHEGETDMFWDGSMTQTTPSLDLPAARSALADIMEQVRTVLLVYGLQHPKHGDALLRDAVGEYILAGNPDAGERLTIYQCENGDEHTREALRYVRIRGENPNVETGK